MFILKKYLEVYLERLGYEFAAIFVAFAYISYFALQICINLTRDNKKKLTKFVDLCETMMY